MLILPQRAESSPVLAAYVADFPSAPRLLAWRRRLAIELASRPELTFAKAMAAIGTAASDGFGAGLPDLHRQIVLMAWRSEDAFCDFAEHPLSRQLLARGRSSIALFEVASTRGSHFGHRPLVGAGKRRAGRFGTLTLGRCWGRTLPAFLREGARLERFVLDAPGLLTAASAGNPMTGNCTLSVWESEDDMIDFAYRQHAGHGATVRRTPPILREQLNARLRLRHVEGEWEKRIRGDRSSAHPPSAGGGR